MPHNFDIRFDNDPPIDNVGFAVVPIDAFTGRIVASAVTANLKGLPNPPIRNRSGMLVFVNLPSQPSYQVNVFSGAAGYFDPGEKMWPVPGDAASANSKRLIVSLFRLPSAGVDTEATTVAGLVVRGAQPEAGAIVQAILPGDALPPGSAFDPFETRTDERGAFVLRMRVPTDPAGASVDVKFRFQQGAFQRKIEHPVEEGRFYSFEKPIDLIGANTPQLVPFGG